MKTMKNSIAVLDFNVIEVHILLKFYTRNILAKYYESKFGVVEETIIL